MDLIILKNVHVSDIKALGLLTFVQGELEPAVNKDPQCYPAPVESLAPCDVEPVRQIEPEGAKKGRGRPSTKTKVEDPAGSKDAGPEAGTGRW